MQKAEIERSLPPTQRHLLRFWGDLSDPQRQRLAEQIASIDFALVERLVQQRCEARQLGSAGAAGPAARSISPGWKRQQVHAGRSPSCRRSGAEARRNRRHSGRRRAGHPHGFRQAQGNVQNRAGIGRFAISNSVGATRGGRTAIRRCGPAVCNDQRRHARRHRRLFRAAQSLRPGGGKRAAVLPGHDARGRYCHAAACCWPTKAKWRSAPMGTAACWRQWSLAAHWPTSSAAASKLCFIFRSIIRWPRFAIRRFWDITFSRNRK